MFACLFLQKRYSAYLHTVIGMKIRLIDIVHAYVAQKLHIIALFAQLSCQIY